MAEWLDMEPQRIGSTNIKKVFLLRKAKRPSAGKRENAKETIDHHPFEPEIFQMWADDIKEVFKVHKEKV